MAVGKMLGKDELMDIEAVLGAARAAGVGVGVVSVGVAGSGVDAGALPGTAGLQAMSRMSSATGIQRSGRTARRAIAAPNTGWVDLIGDRAHHLARFQVTNAQVGGCNLVQPACRWARGRLLV